MSWNDPAQEPTADPAVSAGAGAGQSGFGQAGSVSTETMLKPGRIDTISTAQHGGVVRNASAVTGAVAGGGAGVQTAVGPNGQLQLSTGSSVGNQGAITGTGHFGTSQSSETSAQTAAKLQETATFPPWV